MILFLKALFIVVLVLCCLMLIVLILLQKSKSEGLGLAFGAGAGESLFGARAGNVLSKATVVLGITFMFCTLALGAMFAKEQNAGRSEIEKELQKTEAAVQPSAVQGAPIEGLDLGTPVTTKAAPVDV
ncbi:MAG: preprotein translocase subunit SecG, partial [Kiritimatiellaceae bacterium]|nr:preprotein translocase subunit SecG [Kiritimatiellaceae bacterium]